MLLGWRAAERSRGEGVLAASLVSSPGLEAVARAFDLDYADTLTGFKWISRVGGLTYGYEEALGYLVDPEKVRDKDGISAAVDFLSLASGLKAEGRTIDDRLADFAERFGAYASGQVSLRFEDVDDIGRIMSRLRAELPATVGSLRVDRIDDFRDGFERFPAADLLRLWLGNGAARVIVRPSGTEPKLKVYLDAWSTEGDAAARQAAATAMLAELDRGMRELVA
jgi:phosphomannomutase